MDKLEQNVNPDEYMVVRGIPIRKDYIQQREQEFGAKLVADSAPDVQEFLDQSLFKLRMAAIAKGKSIKVVGNMIKSKTHFYFFIENIIPMGIYWPGFPTVKVATHKPIWFVRARQTRGAKLHYDLRAKKLPPM